MNTEKRALLTQREIYRIVREAVDLDTDPLAKAQDPRYWQRIEAALMSAFEDCPRDAIFSPYVLHQLGRRKRLVLERIYDDWQKARTATA